MMRKMREDSAMKGQRKRMQREKVEEKLLVLYQEAWPASWYEIEEDFEAGPTKAFVDLYLRTWPVLRYKDINKALGGGKAMCDSESEEAGALSL